MKNKLISGFLVVGCILPITFAGAWKQSDKAGAESTYKRVGTVLESELKENKNRIVAEGRDIEVSQREVAIRCELSKYSENAVSQEEAVKELVEEKALYEEAVKHGFQISDAELDKEMAELKEVVRTSENSEEIQEMISVFENEDVYWEYVRERNLIKGTILAYQQSLQEQYCDKAGIKLETDVEEKEWEEYMDQVVEKAVDKQEVELKIE